MKWISHIVQGLLTISFLMAGLSKLFSSEGQIKALFTDPLGYAPSFIYFIGAIETVAAFALIAGYWWRRAAAGSSLVLIVVMIGAIVSLLKANAASDVMMPAVNLLLLIALLVRLIRSEAVFRSHFENI